jgi:hypothetical protein
MTENIENLILEHLRHIRGRVDQVAEDALSLVRREIILGDESSARQQAAIDRIIERLERIERRLELTDG